ncbi:hypothetical protein CVM73_21920 [Bradyrhizobium forestalis]|uniref:Alanine racemase C-terminal domain-containing protein n=1 Tax=Bradyrhizobium forestalis TaxID=1419263 RepID=A0A2M8R5G1_9BRAD|nr:alanine racemase C-terminal domain-containing protein [Bradyrhizobium forestalis]PJG53055.1 hypothetical protein CVM73_21920 [Bradyrhizobium forestalis]
MGQSICISYSAPPSSALRCRTRLAFRAPRLTIVGRDLIDSMTVDISGLSDEALDLGSLVEVIGPHQTLVMLAADAGTISCELLTGLGHRFRRDYR